MKLDIQTTRKIAKLARLQISDAEASAYTDELEKILAFVAQLNEVQTDGVEPIVHGLQLDPHFRADEAIALSEEKIQKILQCSQQSLYEQYKVPQVIGGEG